MQQRQKTRSTVSAAKNIRGTKSATKESDLKGINTLGTDVLDTTTISAALPADTPLGEQIEVEEQMVRNIPEGSNIFDEEIGYGVALPGESGVAAVERIKARKKVSAKVKKTKR